MKTNIDLGREVGMSIKDMAEHWEPQPRYSVNATGGQLNRFAEALLADKDAEIAALQEALASNKITLKRRGDCILSREAEVEQLRAIAVALVAYDDDINATSARRALNWADMLRASRAAIPQAVQPSASLARLADRLRPGHGLPDAQAAQLTDADYWMQEYTAARQAEFRLGIQLEAKDAEIAVLRLDAELGNIAMRFVDRAGDTCPDVDSAETICAEFYKAMGDAVCKARPIAMQAKAAPPAVISIAGGGGGGSRSFT